MHCVITAGGLPGPDDPLYELTRGKPKALLDVCGRTMLERVMDALQGSKYIEKIVVVGLEDNLGMQFKRPVDQFLPDQGSLVGNALAGVHWVAKEDPEAKTVLFCTADIPALSAENVDRFVEECQPLDKAVYYIFVPREAMEARFPHSDRTYTKLRGIEIAGGDVSMAQVDLADEHEILWTALTNARKHAWQLARVVGLKVLLKLLFRRLSVEDIEATAERIVNRPVKIVLDAPAEMAMDVDKPQQLELLRADVARRQQS